MNKTALTVMMAALVVAATLPAAAQTTVAVIDVQRVVTESDPGKEALQGLQKLQEQKIAEGRALQEELAALREQVTKQRFTLSEAKLAELTRSIEDKDIAFRRFEDDATREIDEARRTALGRLEERIMPVIDEVGRERELTLIFNKYQSGLVYADETIDITDDVIRRFNMAQ
jgi:outer membrane protein